MAMYNTPGLPPDLAAQLGHDPAAQQSYMNLLSVLRRGEMPDKYLQNRDILDQTRGVAGQRDALAGKLAATGLTRSRGLQAMGNALGGVQVQVADQARRNAAIAGQDRFRQALQTYYGTVLNPAQGAYQTARGNELSDEFKRLKAKQDRWDKWAALAKSLASTTSSFSGMGGGGGGTQDVNPYAGAGTSGEADFGSNPSGGGYAGGW